MPDMGVCVLSIDVLHDDARTVDLCRRLSDASVPVTWGLSSPPSSELADAIRGHAASEVALRADGWASEPADRRTFSQSLIGGLAQLRAVGFDPTTIVLSAGSVAAHDDLLVKHSISALRVTARRDSSSRRAPQLGRKDALNCLTPIRWGLWEAVVGADLSQAGQSAALRTIDRICGRDAVAIIASPSDFVAADLKTASRLVNHLTGRRQQQAFRVTTLAAIVAELRAARPASSRSILRPAA